MKWEAGVLACFPSNRTRVTSWWGMDYMSTRRTTKIRRIYIWRNIWWVLSKSWYIMGVLLFGALETNYQNFPTGGFSYQGGEEGHFWWVSNVLGLFVVNSITCNVITLVIIICRLNKGWRGVLLIKMWNSANSGYIGPFKCFEDGHFFFPLKVF